MEIANNNVIDDLLSNPNIKVESNLKDGILELKYLLETEESISNLSKNKVGIQKEIHQIKERFGFTTVWCRFDFGKNPEIADSELKSLTNFQVGIFDEITIQKVGRNIDQFKRILEYAVNKLEMKVSVLLDIKEKDHELLETLNILDEITPDSFRCLYGKFSTHLQNYLLVVGKMKKLGLPYYLVACLKRCGIKDTGNKEGTNVGISVIAQSKLFGFHGCCQEYLSPEKRRNPKGFPTHTDVFNPDTGLWEKHKVIKNFREVRIKNYLALGSVGEIEEEEAVKAVLAHLLELREQ